MIRVMKVPRAKNTAVEFALHGGEVRLRAIE
jgi:hypothetical protein